MRRTPQREAILRVLQASDRPLTVDEIWGAMAQHRSGIPTVYRNHPGPGSGDAVRPLLFGPSSPSSIL
jgi:hypothetical protein